MALLSLERSLTNRLRQHSVRIEVPDTNTACFRNVPANARFFNKPTTNLLAKRPDAELPVVAGGDQDLQYHGNDGRIGRALAERRHDHGWGAPFHRRPGG